MTSSTETVCGIDEAGRGALAGPIVAAGVVLASRQKDRIFSSGMVIRDGKTMSPKQRRAVFDLLVRQEVPFALSTRSVREIDRDGIGTCNRDLFSELVGKLHADRYVLDGNLKIAAGGENVLSVPRADGSEPSVILAGIIAKYLRDALLHTLAVSFPAYGWDKNAGYGTRYHIRQLSVYGPSPHHRRRFTETALIHARLYSQQKRGPVVY